MLQKIKIYGSDSNIKLNGKTVKYPLETAVLALLDVQSFELDVKGAYAQLQVETDTKTFWNKTKLMINNAEIAFNPQSMPIDYPASVNTIEAFYGLNVLKKKYKWVNLYDYKLMPSGAVSGTVIAVNVSGWAVADNGDGTKNISLTLSERG